MSVNSRNKGSRGEREVIAEIQKVFGVKYARTPLSGGMDIKGDIRKPFEQSPTLCDMFHWEVKYQEHINIWKCMEQSVNDARKDVTTKEPIVVFRRNHTPWFAMLRLDLFLEMLLELQQWRRSGEKEGQDGFHLLSPLGSHPDLQIQKDDKEKMEDWIVEKDKHQAEQRAKKKKKEELKKKYGNRS